MALHICHGSGEEALLDLTEYSETGEVITWTVNSQAVAGDIALFYITAPVSALVARASLITDASREGDPDSEWHGRYMASMNGVQMLSHPIPLARLKANFPEWGWLKSPVMSTRVPAIVTPALESMVEAHELDVEIDGHEGDSYLATHLRRERSRELVFAKREAVLRATGKLACEACGFDFRATYGEAVGDFCEVHHLVPLSALTGSTRVSLADLSVVCSNCHRAIHRIHPMPSPRELASLLRRT